jgi:hypothetical protein
MSESDHNGAQSGRWQRRELRRRKEKERIQKHGATLRRVYADAVRKRARRKGMP